MIAYRKDGALVWVELIIVALRCAQGEITGYLGIHRDIAERKRAEEALSAAQRGSKTIRESMSDEFFALDREWRYTHVNERALATARRAVGRDITRPELFGMPVWEPHPAARRDHDLPRVSPRDARERVAEFEAYSEATRNWVEIRVYPTERGLTGYSHDISARKWAQEEVSRRADQQALVAALRQRALASDDLQSVFDEAVGVVARTSMSSWPASLRCRSAAKR